jgi:two-component system sensor histidine kinase VicK
MNQADGQRVPICLIKTPSEPFTKAIKMILKRTNGLLAAYPVTEITMQKTTDCHKDDLLLMLGHELKAPLSTIKLYIQMVIKGAKCGESLLLKADNQVDEVTAIIDNLLDMSMIVSGKLALRTQPFDMSILIEEVIYCLFPNEKTHIIKTYNESVQMICADRGKIKQVIQNLLSNAIKYSPKQSVINIVSTTTNGHLQVSIRDNGIGISMAHQQKLFTRFYRVSSVAVQKKKGYGIGLFLVKEIVRQHGGQVWVESTEGCGSAFYFSLPKKI